MSPHPLIGEYDGLYGPRTVVWFDEVKGQWLVLHHGEQGEGSCDERWYDDIQSCITDGTWTWRSGLRSAVALTRVNTGL